MFDFGKIGETLGNIGGTIKQKMSPLAEKLSDGLEKSREKWEERSDEDKLEFLEGLGSSQQVNPYASLGNLTSNVNFQTQPLQQRQMQYYMPYERNFY